MKKETILRGIAGLMAIMWFYAAIIKLTDYQKSLQEMQNQVFSVSIANILTWAVPVTELILIPLLIVTKIRLKGMYASLALLIIFSFYIAITMTGVFGRVPCSCANIISEQTTYGEQLIFNMGFIALVTLGITIENGWLKKLQNLFNSKRKELAQS